MSNHIIRKKNEQRVNTFFSVDDEENVCIYCLEHIHKSKGGGK